MSNTEHDHDWLAFLYVAGEMSEAESTAFEQHLLQDQPAREALARAVQLTAAVRSACRPVSVPVASVSPVPVSSARPWRTAVAGCAVAALVLVSVSIGLFDGDQSSDDSVATVAERPSASSNAGSLVAMWTESNPRRADSQDDVLAASSEFDANCVACLDAADFDAGELNVPSWMLAAVGGNPKPDQNQLERREDN
jgi:ferric-dicitrate binding protein FerR (iron transport regulator)